MQRKEAQTIVLYFYAIPGMVAVLNRERREIEEDYYSLRGVSMDGMPHGTTPGKPVESVAIALEESGAADRLREIGNRVGELEADRREIQAVIDGLNSRYNSILNMKYLHGYSWGATSARLGVPDSTIRHWHDKALEKLGKELESLPKKQEILNRASRARV